MQIFEHPDFDDHEKILFCTDRKTGLKGIIAIHSTALGPAAGGCRMYPYESTQEALTDVLRLSRGMSYKNAVAGLPLGGGKCVIIADSHSSRKPELLRAFSRHVQDLGGQYWTAIDIGVSPEDADILAENCDYVFCRASHYEEGFSPASFTALGGFVGIQAVSDHLWNRRDLKGVRVAIQGLGGTGADLAHRLNQAGAELVVADVREQPVREAVEKYGAQPVSPETVHAQEVDVFSPCAMGAIINDKSLPEIRAQAICGLANNQLEKPEHGAILQKRGITYVPDYVVNAGGVIGGSALIFETPSRERSIARIEGLFDTIKSILEQSAKEGRPTSEIADAMALARIDMPSAS